MLLIIDVLVIGFDLDCVLHAPVPITVPGIVIVLVCSVMCWCGLCLAWHGMVWYGLIWYGIVWYGVFGLV